MELICRSLILLVHSWTNVSHIFKLLCRSTWDRQTLIETPISSSSIFIHLSRDVWRQCFYWQSMAYMVYNRQSFHFAEIAQKTKQNPHTNLKRNMYLKEYFVRKNWYLKNGVDTEPYSSRPPLLLWHLYVENQNNMIFVWGDGNEMTAVKLKFVQRKGNIWTASVIKCG